MLEIGPQLRSFAERRLMRVVMTNLPAQYPDFLTQSRGRPTLSQDGSAVVVPTRERRELIPASPDRRSWQRVCPTDSLPSLRRSSSPGSIEALGQRLWRILPTPQGAVLAVVHYFAR